jgi:PAS domain S-box-containing protein
MLGQIEQALTMLAGKGASGKAFFEIAAQALTIGMGVRWAGVARVSEDGLSVGTLALSTDGAIADPLSYPLRGTPCSLVYAMADAERSQCLVPERVCERFPEDRLLRDLGAVSYRGELFFDAAGNPAGHVFILDDLPMIDSPEERSFFQLVTQRVGSEYNRWRTEQALLESEARLRHAAKLARVGYWVWDEVEDRAAYISDELGRMFGFETGEDYLAQLSSAAAHRRFVHPDDRERYEEANTESLRENTPLDIEYRILTRHGEVRYIKEIGEPVLDERGRRVRTSGMVHDVTVEREAGFELEESTARLRRAAQLARLGHWAWDDLENRAIYCSDELARIFGYESGAEFLPVMNAAEPGLDLLHPEDRAFYRKLDERGRRTRQGFGAEYRIITRAGEVRHVHEITEYIVDEAGRLVRINGVLQDTTELKQAQDALLATQRRLEAIADHSPALIALKDLEGRYVFTNKEFERIHRAPPGWFIGKTVFETFSPKTAAAFDEHDQEVRRTLRAVQREQFEPIGERDRLLMEIKFPIFDARGEPIGIGLVATDITERKQAEITLRHAKQEAEEATRAKSRFLASMSHELRTPLNAIIGITEMLQEDLDDRIYDGLSEGLARIDGAGKHLLTLIDDILDLSKIEAGRLEFVAEEFAISELVAEVVMTTQPLAEKNGNRLIVKSPKRAVKMRADPLRVRQIMLNLLSNACKFTRAGEIVLEVAPRKRDGAEWVYFRVKDTGIGIAPEQMKILFDEFTQAHGHSRRTGSGLGLAITRRLCDLMAGEVWAESAEGKGSTFTVRLPLAQPAPASA